MGGYASSCYPPDREHMVGVINRVKPRVILSFGKVAQEGLQSIMTVLSPELTIIYGPHPAARHADVLADLRVMRAQLEEEVRLCA